MMGIGPIVMGTTAAASGSSAGLTVTPEPMWIAGNYWSFNFSNFENELGRLSLKSTDLGITWVEDTDQTSGTVNIGTDKYANGILAGAQGSFVNHKSLAGGFNWIATSVSSITGGFISGGTNQLHVDTNLDRFILVKNFGQDIYTSTDLVNYTVANGAVENDLTLNSRLQTVYNLVYAGAQYVAYGIKTYADPLIPGDVDVYGSAVSTDLITWTAQATTAPLFFDIQDFNGAWIGVALNGSTAQTRTIEVWRSTDFITWTKQTLPNANAGSSFEGATIQSGIYHLISNSQIFESVNGTTWTEYVKEFNVDGKLYGREPILSGGSMPVNITLRSGTVDEYGGKILRWSSSLESNPALRYPSTGGATVGFTGTSLKFGAGIADKSFSVIDVETERGFYLHKTNVRYFEFTILSHSGTLNAQIGMDVPAEKYFSGLSTTRVQLSSAGVVETSSGNVPVTYTMAAGQVVGFVVNFITATVDIYVDDVFLTQIPNLATSVLWTQLLDCSNAGVKLNVGQDTFVHTKAGTVAWNS